MVGSENREAMFEEFLDKYRRLQIPPADRILETEVFLQRSSVPDHPTVLSDSPFQPQSSSNRKKTKRGRWAAHFR